MPSPETSALRDYAVLWTNVGNDNYGEPVVGVIPVEIRCRWESGIGEQLSPLTGALQETTTLVWVDRDIPVDSIMWHGRLKDLPNPTSDLREVIEFDKIPDIKGRRFTRVVKLIKFGGKLPKVV